MLQKNLYHKQVGMSAPETHLIVMIFWLLRMIECHDGSLCFPAP
jgi:hypothetical protein